MTDLKYDEPNFANSLMKLVSIGRRIRKVLQKQSERLEQMQLLRVPRKC